MIKRIVREPIEDQPESRGHPVGIVLIDHDKQTEILKMGWSQCSHQDRFDKSLGMTIAQSRLDEDPLYVNLNNYSPGDIGGSRSFGWRPSMNEMIDLVLDRLSLKVNVDHPRSNNDSIFRVGDLVRHNGSGLNRGKLGTVRLVNKDIIHISNDAYEDAGRAGWSAWVTPSEISLLGFGKIDHDFE